MIDTLKDKNILVIVESPNKTAHIQEYLTKAGYSKVKVMASVGHISNIKDNKDSYKNTGIYPEKDFYADFQITEDKKDIVKKLKIYADNADLIYLATDPDREGEAIAWSLKKFLKLDEAKTERMVTHEITPKAVVKAFENPVAFDDNLVAAAHARAIIDKLIGYVLSIIAKTYVGAKSVGRCQSPGLKILVDRELEIRNFKPETYYDLYVNFKKNKTNFKAKYIGTEKMTIDHLKDKLEITKVMNECNGGKYTIKDIIKHEKQEATKPPFNTPTFQQEANSKLGLSVKDAMSIAQDLFHNGFITYMRTDDTSMSPEFIEILKPYIERTYGKKAYNEPKKGKKQENAQEGHECLRVTNPAMTPEIFATKDVNNLHQKVYKIIWQRTIASALPSAIISETNYLINNGDNLFNMTSKEVIDEGYRKVYSYKDEDDSKDDENEIVKETFEKNEELKNTDLGFTEKQTQPRPRYKEATFVKELQKLEIGRPSTYATIVETILSPSRGYCGTDQKTKQMIPSELGITLTGFLDRNFNSVISLTYTKEMEADLDKIANGKLDKLVFLKEFLKNLEDAVNANTEGKTKDTDLVCPLCGAPMIIRRNKWGKLFAGCSKYPSCKGIVNL